MEYKKEALGQRGVKSGIEYGDLRNLAPSNSRMARIPRRLVGLARGLGRCKSQCTSSLRRDEEASVKSLAAMDHACPTAVNIGRARISERGKRAKAVQRDDKNQERGNILQRPR